MIILPNNITNLINNINIKGSAVIVGGYIRDYFLDIKSYDIDIEVYYTSYTKLKEILKPYNYTEAKNFNVIMIKIGLYHIDITLPRTENKKGVKHNDYDIIFNPFMSYADAFKRRDFTINAIGYDTKLNKVIDIYRGIYDIDKKCLHYVNEVTFSEDALRVFRAVRFCTKLNFTISSPTINLCKKISSSDEINILSKERISSEVIRTFSYPNRVYALKLYRKLGLISECVSAKEYKKILVKLRDIKTSDIEVIFAILYIYIKNHKTLEKLCSSKKMYKKVLNLIKYYKVIKKLRLTKQNINRLNQVTDIKKLSIMANKKILNQNIDIKPLINGNFLKQYNIKPYRYKTILSLIYKKQLNLKLQTISDTKAEILKYISKFPSN